MAAQLDELDRKILAELQEDAEQSLDEIARKVGSSKTPVWNRIRRMREQGVILKQTALLDAESLGLEACFFVLIRTSQHEADWQRKFLQVLRSRPEVLEAHRLAGDIDYAGEKTMCALQVAVELLNQTEGYSNYDKFQQGAGMITTVIRKARAHVAQRALDFAEEYKNDSVIYTMGSGAGYGAAYMESICIFMEMQWIHSGTIHTGEFFHGPFEVTDANTPFVIQVSEGSTRELDERCLKFLHTYAKRIEVLDAKELGLSVIDPAVVDYFNHSLFNNVYPIYNHALAETRQHPLTTRRYMWKVAY